MNRLLRRLGGAVIVLALLVSATPASSAAAAVPQPVVQPAPQAAPLSLEERLLLLEDRFAAMEKLLAQMERALALSTLDVPKLAAKAAPAVVSIYLVDSRDRVQSQGTGFIVDSSGILITNAHVVESEHKVKVKFATGQVATAERMLVDPFLDLAVLDIEGEDYPTLPFAETKPAVGEPVMVIGNAWGYSNSVTVGIVSGVDRPDPYHFYHYPSLQTDAAINHGNSGGPILNAAGEVVAIASWTELKGRTDGIAFGVPMDQVEAALDRYQEGRGIVRPWLAASVREPYWARGGLPNEVGLLVSGVHSRGAGYRAGLRPGDWITRVEGKPVNYLMELRAALEAHNPGALITLTVEREDGSGKWVAHHLKVQLGEYSGAVPMLVPVEYGDDDDLF